MTRVRAGSMLSVLAFVAATRSLAPTPETGESWLYLVALPVGYGHLLGALWFGRARMRERLPQDLPAGLSAVLAVVSVANLLAAYTWALRTPGLQSWVLALVLIVSAWHIVENDLALAAAHRERLALGSIEGSGRSHLTILVVTAAIATIAASTPEGGMLAEDWLGVATPALAPFSIAEFATTVLMYHAVSWLQFSWQRSALLSRLDPASARRMRVGLFAVHLAPLAGYLALYACDRGLAVNAASVLIYLFWSVLHALQTAWLRSGRGRAALRAPV